MSPYLRVLAGGGGVAQQDAGWVERPITVPEPLAGHVSSLLAARPATTAGKALGNTAWLFPGYQPARPLHATALAKRLRILGVPVGVSRLAAWAHLAASMPAAVVADLLRVHVTTAAQWARTTGSTWADYTTNRPSRAPSEVTGQNEPHEAPGISVAS